MIEALKNSINDALQLKSKLPQKILDIDGMSSSKIRHLLNNICSNVPDVSYLEIGTWKGSTLFSASYHNKGSFIGIDNFKYFEGPSDAFYKNKDAFKEDCQVVFYEENCWELDQTKLPKINVYLYDGKHSEIEQYDAFIKYNKVLDKKFIAVVDDWNETRVQTSTYKAFKDLNYKVEFEWLKLTSFNGDKENFWNGFFVALINKND